MKVSDLITLLQQANPNGDVRIMQPRSWIKKQPDQRKTSIISVEVWHDLSRVTIYTGDF